MITFRIPVLFLACVGLAACGGGGGGGGGGGNSNGIGSVGLNQGRSGVLANTDRVLPDGSFVDLYQVQTTGAGTLDIVMSSEVLDSYLLLFTSGCTAQADMANWEPCLLTEDDDSAGGASGFDARITITATQAQTFVIGANSFDANEVGPYNLTVSFSTFARAGQDESRTELTLEPASIAPLPAPVGKMLSGKQTKRR